jgi:serine/threonine protein kinase
MISRLGQQGDVRLFHLVCRVTIRSVITFVLLFGHGGLMGRSRRRLVPLAPTSAPPAAPSTTVPDLGIPGICDAVEIGRGASATVYRAVQTAVRRPVAVKVLHTPADPAARLRFEHEALAIGALSDHPNVLTVHDAGMTRDDRPYLVLQYCPTGTLAEHVRRRGPLTWPAAVRIAVDLADALACAHRSRVVHRDLKPQNVLVSDHGRALLADFGVAAVEGAGGAVTAPARIGSVLYMAPEVLDGDPATPSADLYSLAATTYYLLTGLPPIPARPEEGWASLYIRLVTAPPARLPGRLPAALRTLLARCLAKDPSDRPGGTGEFAEQALEVLWAAGHRSTELPTRRDWAGAPIRALRLEPAVPRPRVGTPSES